jgi:DNA invertase Pin-like site-specific DNA recombinase
MTTGFYARVSTQRQENEETIETQIMGIKDKIKDEARNTRKTISFFVKKAKI